MPKATVRDFEPYSQNKCWEVVRHQLSYCMKVENITKAIGMPLAYLIPTLLKNNSKLKYTKN